MVVEEAGTAGVAVEMDNAGVTVVEVDESETIQCECNTLSCSFRPASVKAPGRGASPGGRAAGRGVPDRAAQVPALPEK